MTIYHVLRGQGGPRESVRQVHEGLDLLPASLDLASAELELASTPGREFLLKELLTEVSDYDFIFMDCPPNLGLLTINSLTAAHEIIIPLQTEFLALQSLGRLMETIKVVQKRLNPGLTVGGIVATRFDQRKRLSREVVEKIHEHFGDLFFKGRIRDNISLAEAPSHGQDIFRYKPASSGAEDFSALCREFLARDRP
jgi:chromosome partitioning protein